MKIRPATNADIPMLCNVAEKTWRTCYPGIISHEQIEFMLGWMYSPERLREEMERGVMWEVVENEEQRPVGFLSYELQPDGRVKLHKLYVLPEEQGKGIGRVALEHAMEQSMLWNRRDEKERSKSGCR
jgi:diamine N-acetyltransferase